MNCPPLMWSLVVHLVNQDLSVAGKRAGLAGERSGLFMEQIRIIKEMREADAGRGRTGKFIRPRFMVWENVPGAFSSNKGDDFRAVLEETIRVAEPDAPDVPLPAKGKWPLADCWYGDGWSVAYRVLDAQFWGVPQRRRRIALVADFGGHAAPEILFVRESVCGDTTPGGTAGEETAAGTGSGAGEAIPINTMLATRHKQLGRGTGFGIGEPGEPGFTISTNHCHAVFQASAYRIGSYYSAGMLSDNPKAGIIPVEKSNTLDCNGGAPTSQQGGVCIVQPVICLNDQGGSAMEAAVYVHQNQLGEVRTGPVAGTLNTNSNASGRNAPLVFDARGNGDGKNACTLTGDHQSRVTDYTAIVMETGQFRAGIMRDICPTLNCNHEQPIVATDECLTPWDVQSRRIHPDSGTWPALYGGEGGGHGYVARGLGSLSAYPAVSRQVRRLTPLECERLQGYPDGWTDIGAWTDSKGKLHKESSDAARYKALGNSIALPPWTWVLKRLCACYERDATMASLFDGIGGFPLIWERLNGPGSCLWASEVEEFPIAVTKYHFGRKV